MTESALRNICTEKKLIYIHIPKTGGTSVEKVLFDRENSSEHVPIQYYKEYYPQYYADFYIVTFVRNPYTRMISVYNYYRAGGNKKGALDQKLAEAFRRINSLDVFVDLFDYMKNLLHLKRQIDFIGAAYRVDWIGRFETFNEDLQTLIVKFNIPRQIVHYRSAEYPDDIMVTKKFLEFVDEYYNEDFERFGYSKIKFFQEPLSLAVFNKKYEAELKSNKD